MTLLASNLGTPSSIIRIELGEPKLLASNLGTPSSIRMIDYLNLTNREISTWVQWTPIYKL